MRERLPDRRRSVRVSFRWPAETDRSVHVTAGFAEDGRVLECFLRGGGRVGSDVDALLDDVAILVSRGLQHGDHLADIARGLGRLPGGAPSSIVAAVVDELVRLEVGRWRAPLSSSGRSS
jgi:hypothetical protein